MTEELDKLISYAESLANRGSPYSVCGNNYMVKLLKRLKDAEAVVRAADKVNDSFETKWKDIGGGYAEGKCLIGAVPMKLLRDALAEYHVANVTISEDTP